MVFGSSKAKKVAQRVVEVDSNRDGVVEGFIQVTRHTGYGSKPKAAFKAVDDLLLQKLDDVTAELGFSGDETPGTALRRALTKNVLWVDIEQAFMQSEFWERDGDPLNRTGSFSAHKGLPLFDKVRAKLGASKQGMWDKQVSSSDKFVPEAKKWFDGFVDDADIADSVTLDMKKVWNAVALHDIQLESAHGSPRDEFGIMENSFLEIGIIRFPDIEKPRVKVFRLKLTVWNQCTVAATKAPSILSGIRGVLTSCQFRPRSQHMESIAELVKTVQAGGGNGGMRVSFKGATDVVNLTE